MMVGKEDLGLSLSLSFPEKRAVSNPSSLHLNLMPSSSPSPFSIINKASWTEAFTSSGLFLHYPDLVIYFFFPKRFSHFFLPADSFFYWPSTFPFPHIFGQEKRDGKKRKTKEKTFYIYFNPPSFPCVF